MPLRDPDEPQLPDSAGLSVDERLSAAIVAAAEAGEQIASRFGDLGLGDRLEISKSFRRELIRPKQRGRRRIQALDDAHTAWLSGLREATVFERFIGRYSAMGEWRRKVGERRVMESIRGRERMLRRDQPSSESSSKSFFTVNSANLPLTVLSC